MTSSIQEQTDNVVIGMCIALIAATTVFFQSIPTYTDALKFTIIVSVASITFCLLLSLWHRVRWPRRDSLFKAKLQEHTQKRNAELTHFYNVTLTPITDRMLKERLASIPTYDPTQIKQEIDIVINQARQEIEPLANRFLQGFSIEFESIREKSLNAPLEEKWARLKYFLDYVATKTRIFLFVIGLLLFLASIILRIISQPEIAKVAQ
jgi:hypothetical protein